MALKKVFIPKWQRWLFVPLFVVIWLLITYLEFFSEAAGELGIVGYLLLTTLFLGLGTAFWLMTGGKLPAYYIED